MSALPYVCLRFKKFPLQLLLMLEPNIKRSSRCRSLTFIFFDLVHKEFLHRIKFLSNATAVTPMVFHKRTETADPAIEENLNTPGPPKIPQGSSMLPCARAATVLLPASSSSPTDLPRNALWDTLQLGGLEASGRWWAIGPKCAFKTSSPSVYTQELIGVFCPSFCVLRFVSKSYPVSSEEGNSIYSFFLRWHFGIKMLNFSRCFHGCCFPLKPLATGKRWQRGQWTVLSGGRWTFWPHVKSVSHRLTSSLAVDRICGVS